MRAHIFRLSLFLVACTSCDGDALRLLDGNSEDSDWAERRRLLDVTVLTADEGGALTVPAQVTPATFRISVGRYCASTVSSAWSLANCTDHTAAVERRTSSDITPACSTTTAGTGRPATASPVCTSEIALCMSHVYLELAGAISETTLPAAVGTGQILVPAQSTATIAGFAEEALLSAQFAAVNSGEALRRSAGDTAARVTNCSGPMLAVNFCQSAMPTGPACITANAVSTLGAELAATLVEATRVAEEAADEAVTRNNAVADEDLLAIPDLGLAARAAWTAPVLSHRHALQLISGGTNVLGHIAPGGSISRLSQGVCAVTCGPACRDAVAAIRLSGIDLSTVTSNIAVDALVGGSDGLGARLAERYGDDDLATAGTAVLLDRIGVAPTELEQAREYLRAETAAFNRDMTITAPSPILTSLDGTTRTSEFTYYAATVHTPSAPSPGLVLAASRTGTPVSDGTNPALLAPTMAYGMRGLAQLLDYSQTVARQVVNATTVATAVRQPLATLVALGDIADTARVNFCFQSAAGLRDARVTVLGRSDPSRLLLVDGASGLACATTGRVEGEPCRLSDYRIAATSTVVTAGGRRGYARGVQFDLATIPVPAGVASFAWYLVEQRPGTTNPAAGDYDVLTEVGMAQKVDRPTGATGYTFCDQRAYDPAAMELVARAFPLNADDCTIPATDCYGAPVGPIPLEDILIDDGSMVEDSFEYHLGVAARAAEFADGLGDELIAAGLAMDERAERAVESIETTCGASINLDELFNRNADGTLSLASVLGPTCSATTPCPAGYQCAGTQCVIDLGAVPMDGDSPDYNTEVLAQCLGLDTGGPGEIVPLASLGSVPLCVLVDPDAQNILCESPMPGESCPRVRRDSEPCRDELGEVAVEGANLLELVPDRALTTLTGLAATGDFGPVCRALREIRTLPATETLDSEEADETERLIELIRDSDLFAFDNVRYWAEQLGWQAHPDSYSELTLFASPWYGTGQPFEEWQLPPDLDGVPEPGERPVGPSLAWPCTAAHLVPQPDCSGPGASASLFCAAPIDCEDPVARTHVNHRFARASILLAVLSGFGTANLRLPVMYQRLGSFTPDVAGRWTAQVGEERWRIVSRGTYDRFGGSRSDLVFDGVFPFPESAERAVWHQLDWSTSPPTAVPLRNGVPGTTATLGFVSFGSLVSDSIVAAGVAEEMWSDVSRAPSFVTSHVRDRRGYIDDNSVARAGDTFNFDGGPFSDCSTLRRPVREALRLGRDGLDDALVSGRGCFQVFERLGASAYFSANSYDTYTDDSVTSFGVNSGWISGTSGGGFSGQDILDALELVCEASRFAAEGAATCDPARPPEVRTRDDLPAVRSYLTCLANRLDRLGETLVVQDLPRRVAEVIRGDTTTLRPDEGTYGETISRLRVDLRAMAGFPREVAVQLLQLRAALVDLEQALRSIDASTEISDLRAVSTVASETAACAGAAAGSKLEAAATCANAVVQSIISIRVNDLTHVTLDADALQSMNRFRSTYETVQSVLAGLGDRILETNDRISSDLSTLRTARRTASRELAYALFLSSDEAGRHYNVNTVMRRRYNTLSRRYAEAHRSAVQMAELARLALEQRLGLSLASIDRDLTLVDNPSTWVGSACRSTGIDYARIRSTDPGAPDEYADAYVGDYVRNLQRFFETYRLDYPYTDGRDTIVISLRDDVLHVTESCASASHNLLASSNDLTVRDEPLDDGRRPNEEANELYTGPAGWGPFGCLSSDDGHSDACVAVHVISDAPALPDGVSGYVPLSLPDGVDSFAPPAAFRVTFAPGGSNSEGPPITYTNDAEWAQELFLRRGLHRLSWWERAGISPPPGEGRSTVSLAVDEPVLASEPLPYGPALGGWQRYIRFYELSHDGVARVRITPIAQPEPYAEQYFDVAGLQLEYAGDRVVRSAAAINDDDLGENPDIYGPRDFIATTSRGTALFSTCADTDGDAFRRTHWAYRCDAELCAAGIDRCRDGEVGRNLCYWESSPMTITPDAFDEGGLFEQAGLALGNFNYRISSIALNFTGTGSRICDDPGRPTSCYSTGAIPYSIVHAPPYTVVDYEGGRSYEAPIFQAHINHALGLAAERLITNPVSSADRALLADFTRTEFRGRPLAGTFHIRVWDTGEVNFGGIEDVQIVLDYRYFTRAERPAASAP